MLKNVWVSVEQQILIIYVKNQHVHWKFLKNNLRNRFLQSLELDPIQHWPLGKSFVEYFIPKVFQIPGILFYAVLSKISENYVNCYMFDSFFTLGPK